MEFRADYRRNRNAKRRVSICITPTLPELPGTDLVLRECLLASSELEALTAQQAQHARPTRYSRQCSVCHTVQSPEWRRRVDALFCNTCAVQYGVAHGVAHGVALCDLALEPVIGPVAGPVIGPGFGFRFGFGFDEIL